MSEGNEDEVIQLALDWVRQNGRDGDVAPGDVEEDTNLLLSGVLDSLGFIDLLAFLEERAGLTLDLAELDPEEFTSIGGLARNAFKEGRRAS